MKFTFVIAALLAASNGHRHHHKHRSDNYLGVRFLDGMNQEDEFAM